MKKILKIYLLALIIPFYINAANLKFQNKSNFKNLTQKNVTIKCNNKKYSLHNIPVPCYKPDVLIQYSGRTYNNSVMNMPQAQLNQISGLKSTDNKILTVIKQKNGYPGFTITNVPKPIIPKPAVHNPNPALTQEVLPSTPAAIDLTAFSPTLPTEIPQVAASCFNQEDACTIDSECCPKLYCANQTIVGGAVTTDESGRRVTSRRTIQKCYPVGQTPETIYKR